MTSSHQLINQDSGDVEYYTPPEIVEAARRTMGGIDLDPASSETANLRVKAARIFTQADDGLSQPWEGRVWVNHPFGRTTNAPWILKMDSEYKRGGYNICVASPLLRPLSGGSNHWPANPSAFSPRAPTTSCRMARSREGSRRAVWSPTSGLTSRRSRASLGCLVSSRYPI